MVAYGEWLPGILEEGVPPIELPGPASYFYKSNAIKSINAPTVYGYIVLGDIKTGSCSCYRVEIDAVAMKSIESKEFDRRDCTN
ncbi:MAG TPA: hypothetical protein VKZ84_00465 [Bacteriovoracaceae bacterium]|nr:hypothetical protein [Bacteriovoracaceae bacterium]